MTDGCMNGRLVSSEMDRLIDNYVDGLFLFLLNRTSVKDGTGLPVYSDTGLSDTLATVTIFGSKKGSHNTENHRIE